MSLQIATNFDLRMQSQNVERDSFETIADMKAYNQNYLPPIFHAMCEEDGNMYVYNINNTDNPITGKWRVIQGGGSGSGIKTWNDSTEYFIGDVVLFDNRFYRCNSNHISSTIFDSDIVNWDTLSDDKISEEIDNMLIRKNDGLYVPGSAATDSKLGLVKVDGKTTNINEDGIISVRMSEDDNNALSIGEDNGLYLGEASSTKLGTVKIDDKTIGIDEGVISTKVSERAISNSDYSQSLYNEIYEYTNNNSESIKYKVSYVDSNVKIYINNILIITLSTGDYNGTLQPNDTLKLDTNGYAIVYFITKNIENILTVEGDGLMLNRYANIATNTRPGFTLPDNDTITIDDHGIITATVGANSVSNRSHNLITLIKTYYDGYSSLPKIGYENVIYRVPNGDSFDDYTWKDGSYVFLETTTGSNEDGIYIDEDDTVAIATYYEEGKVKPDGNTIILEDPDDKHNGEIMVNTSVIATQDDINDVNKTIDTIDVNTPTLVEYDEDELYELAWLDVQITEKPEYTTDDLDAILDQVFENFSGGSSGGGGTGGGTEMTTDQLDDLWNSVFTD